MDQALKSGEERCPMCRTPAAVTASRYCTCSVCQCRWPVYAPESDNDLRDREARMARIWPERRQNCPACNALVVTPAGSSYHACGACRCHWTDEQPLDDPLVYPFGASLVRANGTNGALPDAL
jgi:hypothetical protein